MTITFGLIFNVVLGTIVVVFDFKGTASNGFELTFLAKIFSCSTASRGFILGLTNLRF